MDRLVNGMLAVNGGVILNDKNLQFEVMGPGYSTHQTRMVATYAPEGLVKVEMVYDGKAFYVFRFRGHMDAQHYWSRKYNINNLINSKKYGDMAKKTIQAYNIIFGG